MAKKVNKVIDRDLGWKRIKKNLAELAREPAVAIGILAEEAPREDGKLTNVDIGTFHEFGTEHVPQRSFIRGTVDAKRAEINKFVSDQLGRVIEGKETVDTSLAKVGEKVRAEIKGRIRAGIQPQLKPATIKGKGSSKPLVDTGQLLNSITYEVRKK